jgi:hypothetical protein
MNRLGWSQRTIVHDLRLTPRVLGILNVYCRVLAQILRDNRGNGTEGPGQGSCF